MIRYPIYIKGVSSIPDELDQKVWCDLVRSPVYRVGGKGLTGLRGYSDEIVRSRFGCSFYFDTEEARDAALAVLQKHTLAYPAVEVKGGRGKRDREHREFYRLRA